MKEAVGRISSATMALISGTQGEELMKGIVSVVETMLKARDREAFINEARYKDPKRCNLYEFKQWVSSTKNHQSAMHAFVEFECCFAQLSKLDQRLVGDDKVLMFVKSINRSERNAIGIQLEDYDGANGLTKDWTKVERVCRNMTRERWESCRQHHVL